MALSCNFHILQNAKNPVPKTQSLRAYMSYGRIPFQNKTAEKCPMGQKGGK